MLGVSLAFAQIPFGSPAYAIPQTTQVGTIRTTTAELVAEKAHKKAEAVNKKAHEFVVIEKDNLHKPKPQYEENDPFRETLLKYAGFTNEVGESFARIFPRLLKPSYGIAYNYVAADTLYETIIQYRLEGEHMDARVLEAGADAFIWNSLACIILPGYCVNRVVWLSRKVMDSEKADELPDVVKEYSPTVVGLGSILIIVDPIDKGVDTLMNITLRALF